MNTSRSIFIGLTITVLPLLFMAACTLWPSAPPILPQLQPAASPTSPPRPIPRGLAPVPTPTPQPWTQTDNYLVLGIDKRPGDQSWRTDTIMVVAIDWEWPRVGIVSIPRDLYVDIPGRGEARINTADSFGESSKYPGGGPVLLRRVITQTFGIDAPHYVRINMQEFVNLVDTLGGVTVTLDCPLYEAAPVIDSDELFEWSLPAGEVWLNGIDALRFATFRYYSSDFDRARRQQMLLWALRERALQVNAIARLPELWMAFQKTIQTNLGLRDILPLAQLAVRLKPEDVHGLTFDFSLVESFTTEQGGHVLRVRDPEALKSWINGVFEARPIWESPYPQGQCPPRPALPTATPTAAGEGAPAVKGEPTPAPAEGGGS